MWWIALEAAFIQAPREGAVKTEISLLLAGVPGGVLGRANDVVWQKRAVTADSISVAFADLAGGSGGKYGELSLSGNRGFVPGAGSFSG
jgi:hypothetical protein